MVVTKLNFQKNQKRVNVFLDGTFAFSLSTAVVLKESLHSGKKLSQRTIKKLLIDSWLEELYERSLNYLSIRPRSQKEITLYLGTKIYKLFQKQKLDFFQRKSQFHKHKQELIEKVIFRLKQNNFINDEKFAFWLVTQRLQFKPKGKRVLMQELKQKGVSDEIIRKIFQGESLYSGAKEQKVAFQIAEKIWSQLDRLTQNKKDRPLVMKRRLWNRLQSRGFSLQVIKKIVDDFTSRE